jgi:hypothetical protein
MKQYMVTLHLPNRKEPLEKIVAAKNQVEAVKKVLEDHYSRNVVAEPRDPYLPQITSKWKFTVGEGKKAAYFDLIPARVAKAVGTRGQDQVKMLEFLDAPSLFDDKENT